MHTELDGPLIEAEPLVASLAADPRAITVLDVRWELGAGSRRGDYLDGHLPGAAFVDLDRDLAAPPGPRGRHPLPERERFAAAMRRAGVCSEGAVVLYDGAGALAAARGWWLLRYFGHPAVAVLNGGLAAWRAAGGALERGSPDITLGDFLPVPGSLPLLDADTAAALALGGGLLLDARAPERFRGEVEPIDPVAGRIPGALNRPTVANLGPDNRFLTWDELRAAFVALGARPGRTIGAYCGSGVTAAHELLALEVAGFPRAALYPGSWSEWITDPSRHVARG